MKMPEKEKFVTEEMYNRIKECEYNKKDINILFDSLEKKKGVDLSIERDRAFKIIGNCY